MADEAVATAHRIAVLATLPTTCVPTPRLIAERAALADADADADVIVIVLASMASAAGAAHLDIPVLTSLIPGIRPAGQSDASASPAAAASTVSTSIPRLFSTDATPLRSITSRAVSKLAVENVV